MISRPHFNHSYGGAVIDVPFKQNAAGVALLLLAAVLLIAAQPSLAQRATVRQKVPSAQKIVDKYLKAIGGKKKVAAIRDSLLEWTIELQGQSIGVARHHLRAPATWRSETTFANGQILTAANSRSAWSRGLNGELRTLTGREAGAAKLQAVLEAGHLVDFKKNNVVARVVSLGDLASEPAFIVEFSTRSGSKVVYHFSSASGLITKITDDTRQITTRLSDYRAVAGLMLPHRMSMDLQGTGQLTFILQKAQHNTSFADSIFDPPSGDVLDVQELLWAVERNQDELEHRFSEYSFVQKEVDREFNSKGEIKKETSKTYEVFPMRNRRSVLRLIRENDVPLTAERAAKAEKRRQEGKGKE